MLTLNKTGINDWLKLGFSIFTCLMAGLMGSIATSSSVSSWYPFLNKPFFTPPNFLFGPVWTVLYIMMGISLFLFWKNARKEKLKIGSFIFGLQLFFNALWSFAFFGAQSLILGLIVIALLDVAVAATIFYFMKVNKVATYLLVPYMAWISFATVLNFSLLLLN